MDMLNAFLNGSAELLTGIMVLCVVGLSLGLSQLPATKKIFFVSQKRNFYLLSIGLCCSLINDFHSKEPVWEISLSLISFTTVNLICYLIQKRLDAKG